MAISLPQLSITDGVTSLESLVIYILGMVAYSVFIFKLYKFVSRQDIFKLELRKYARGKDVFKNVFKVVLYVLEYLILFPLLIIGWFLVFTILLALLSDSHTFASLLIVSMSLVSTIRIAAYYNEDLAQDLGKMIPLALLAIFLIDRSIISQEGVIEIFRQIPLNLDIITYYLIFTIALEFVLRIIHFINPFTIKETKDGKKVKISFKKNRHIEEPHEDEDEKKK